VIYTAILEAEPDGRYSTHLPALPGVHSMGATRQEALERIVEAAGLWIDVEKQHRRVIPPNEPLIIVTEVSRLIIDQRADGLDPQLELVSVTIPVADREAARLPALPVVSGDEVRLALEKAGWNFEIQRGSHLIMTRPGRPSIPIPRDREISRGTLRGIIHSAGLTVDEFIALLTR
jgi:predicted RNase H-like HicB family nuclease/predicted RNA binding protein YcfA (HicA-like mRNA interferase family)